MKKEKEKKYKIFYDDVINMLHLGMSQAEIAEQYQCSRATMSIFFKKNNINKWKKINPELAYKKLLQELPELDMLIAKKIMKILFNYFPIERVDNVEKI